MKLTIEIQGDSSAFYYENGDMDFDEFSRILEKLADDLTEFNFAILENKNLFDTNGKLAGFYKFTHK